MKKNIRLAALFLGITFDFLFWKKAPGISFAIFTALCILCGYLLLKAQNIRPARMTVVLLVPIVFFAIMTFNRLEPFTQLLNYALTLLCMALFAATYRSGRWISFRSWDYVITLLRLLGGMLATGWNHISGSSTQQLENSAKGKFNNIWPILRGLIIAIPLLLLFGALFSSADLIFAQKVDNLFAAINLEKITEILARGFNVLIIAYFLIGIFSYAANRSQNGKQNAEEKPILTPFLGYVEATVILGSILLLFGAFVAIQFQYFFSGQANIRLTGFSYSEYARRGFGELVAVAAFSLMLIQGLGAVTKRETARQKKIFSGLGIGLVALVIVILISSFKRLYLYEIAYGFTRLRAYSHVFIIWLGILLAGVVVLEVSRRQQAFATATLIVLLGFAASVNLLNVDAFIVKHNINRTIQGMVLDTAYLSSLTNDAVPTLAREAANVNFSPEIKNEIGAVLACLRERQDAKAVQSRHWQSFNLSDWRAAREMQKMQDTIEKYPVQDETGVFIITGPNGSELICER